MNEPNPAPPIICEIVRSIATVRFNRLTESNSLSTTTLAELDTLLSTLIGNRNLQAIIFTGTDNAFLSGADIRELATLDIETAVNFSRTGQRVFQKIAEASQTTIAAVNGFCMGGGMDLALACDNRVASPSAVFAHPGARLGIITGWGGTQRLPRIIGKARTIELFTTARRLTSTEALKIGLITAIYEPVLEGAINVAKTL
jgi:enoyl-CoA hydratase